VTADPASPEDRLAALGLQLPTAPPPLAHFEMCVRTGSLLFLSGHAPLRDGQFEYVGKVGREWDEAAGYQAARLTALNMLATLKAELGELGKVRRFIKLLGMVNCTEDFTRVPDVINGASDLLIEVFGDAGRHARSAVGMQQLHYGMAVEVEAILEIDD
jgi:enamine deaminase RidA (YjgF/YER057c/UK114 family)